MADSPKPFTQFAGQVLFPRTLTDLTDTTQCPACFRGLSSTVCGNCGLDLGHPESSRLAAISSEAAELIENRTEIIGQMRFETKALLNRLAAEKAAAAAAEAAADERLAAEKASARAAASAAVAASAVVAEPVAAPAAATAPPAHFPRAPSPSSDPRRRGSSVQVLLLIVAISLLSAAAIAFLVYAFINFNIAWRSAIIATFTVATFVIASWLRRRDFASTSEGIAVFAVVLVYLDAFAIRANDLFGAASANAQVYWGATLLLSAVGFIVWHRLSGLRVASVAGFAAVAPGAGLLAFGLGDGSLDFSARFFLGFAVTALAGVVHPLAGRRATGMVPAHSGSPERIVTLSIAATSLLVSIFSALGVLWDEMWAGTFSLLLVAAIAATHVVVGIRQSTGSRAIGVFARIFAGLGTGAAALALISPVMRGAGTPYSLVAPAVAAVAIMLSLDVLTRRLSHRTAIGAARTGAIVAASIAALAVIPSLIITARVALEIVGSASVALPGRLGLSSTVHEPVSETLFAVLALASVVVVFVVFSALDGRLRERRTVSLASVAVVLVIAVPMLSVLWAVTGAWLLIGAAGITLVVRRRETLPFDMRVIALLAAASATLLGYVVSWASLDTWHVGSLATLGIILGARATLARTSEIARAVILGLAVVIAWVGASAVPRAISLAAGSPGPATAVDVDAARFVGILSILLLIAAALPRLSALSRTDRHTLYWMALPALVVTTLFFHFGSIGLTRDLLLPEYGTSLAIGVAALGALLLWSAHRGTVTFAVERVISALLIAPAVYGVVHAITRVAEVPAIVASVAPVVSGLLVAAGALAISVARPAWSLRVAADAGIAAVAVIAIFLAFSEPAHPVWLALLLAGVTALLLAVSADGLFASSSPRRYLGWVALALATLGLWWRLIDVSVPAIEPYVLPLAGTLLLVALLTWRVSRKVPGTGAAPFIALGGLIVGIVPIAMTAANGPLERPIIVGSLSAALLLAGSLIRGTERLRPYLDVAALAGAIGVLVVAAGRAAGLAQQSAPDARLDLWLGSAFLVLFAAAFGQAVTRATDNPRLRAIAGQVLGVAAMAIVLYFEGGSLRADDYGFVRAFTLVLLFAVLHVVALTLDRGPLRSALGWTALGFTAVAVVVGVTSGALTTTEVGAIVIITALISSAVALIVTIRGWSTTPRILREAGLATLGIVSVLLAVSSNNALAWLVLAIAAVTALLLAVGPEGLFAATSRRKHLGWLALALATGALWWRLDSDGADRIELFVLPLAGALLLIALLAWRSQTSRDENRAGAAPIIALGGLLAAILPIGLSSATGSIERALIVGAVSLALLLAGSFVMRPQRVRPYLDIAAIAGAVGVLVVTIGRAYAVWSEQSVPDARLDAWLGAGFLALMIAAFGQSVERAEENPRLRSLVSQGLGIVALTTVFVFMVTSLDSGPVGSLRALAVIWLFAAVHVIAVAIDRAPLTRLLGWVAFAFSAVTSVSAIAVDALEPIELATVPVALALLATGVIHLSRVDAARSWPALGPGMLLLFVPSLLMTMTDRPLWRLIAIAIVGIAAILIGLFGRLQSPFLVGIVVTTVHSIATFSPQIRAAYEATGWLVWIIIGAIGGTLLTVLAARYEKSLSSARSTIRRVTDLR